MVTEKKRIVKLMQGNEACAHGAIAAGCCFFAGYPITPSSEVAEELSELLPMVGGKFIQMEDEIAAMAAVIGASLTGAKSLTATSGPGFSLKQENLGYAAFCEVPCVIVDVMRGGPSTGLPTSPAQSDVMQTKWGTHGDHPIIVLTPASVREIYDHTIRAFNLSEKYRTPVIIAFDEVIGHMREKIEIPDPSEYEIISRKKPTCKPEEYLPYVQSEDDIPPMANFGEGYRYHVTGLAHDERGFPTQNPAKVQALEERLLRKIERDIDSIIDYEEYKLDDAEYCIFAYGSTARSARRAIVQAREAGIKVGLFRPVVLWPFPDKAIDNLANHIKCFIVAEMNLGQIIFEVERTSHGKSRVVGCNKADGEPITPAEIFSRLKEVI